MFIQDELRSGLYYDAIIDTLGNYELEHNVPIRILVAPNGTTPTTRGWVAGHVRDSEFSVTDGSERGITIWHYTTSRGVQGQGNFSAYLDAQQHYYLNGFVVRNTEPVATMWMDSANRPAYSNNESWHRTDAVPIGEITPNTIYDWIGFLRYETSNIPESYKDSLIAALDQCRNAEFCEHFNELANQRAIAALAAYANRTYQSRINSIRTNIGAFELQLAEHEASISRTMHSLIQEQNVLDAILNHADNDADSRVVRDFRLLREHNRIQLCEFSGSVLHLITTDDFRITRPDTGESRWLGAFDITIDFVACTTTILNLNTPRQGRQHPHVSGNGQPCFGGHEGDFRQLLLQGEMLLYFELLVQYLETLNLHDSWGSYGSFWFEAEDMRPIPDPDNPHHLGQPMPAEAVA